MKTRRKKLGYALLILLIVVAVCGGYWAWKYYGLPEWLDDKECKTIEERADKALKFARRHDMNEHYALFVDLAFLLAHQDSLCGTSIRRRLLLVPT